MGKYEVETVMSAVSGKKSRHFNYEYKVLGKKERNIISVRHSKKGGATFSKALYDLVYLAGKIDPYWMDKLVQDKEFPIVLEMMQEAYKKNKFIGWSPETVKELKKHAKEVEKDGNNV